MSRTRVQSPFCDLTLAIAGLSVILLSLGVTSVHSDGGLALDFNLENGGYSLDVEIATNVPHVVPLCGKSQGSCSTTDYLKEVFTNASQLLHQATNFYAHIGLVRFILPDSWPLDNLGGKLRCHTESTKPAINIRSSQEVPLRANVPHGNATRGNQSEGSMDLPWELLHSHTGSRDGKDDTRSSTAPAKLIVHEFAHLRWGLRDEYREGDFTPLCPKALKQTHMNTTQDRASLMADTNNENVVHFCGNSTDPHFAHDSTAKDSRQNKECAGRSSWEVMRGHGDFRLHRENLTRKDDRRIQPTFLYTMPCTRERTIFLVDQSNSSSQSRFSASAAAAIRYYIRKIATKLSSTGIITYGGSTSHPVQRRPGLIITTGVAERRLLSRGVKKWKRSNGLTFPGRLGHGSNFQEAREAAYKLIGEPPLSDNGGTSTYQIIVLSNNMANYSQHLCSPLDTNFRLDEFFLGSCPTMSVNNRTMHTCGESSAAEKKTNCASQGRAGRTLKGALRDFFQFRTRLVLHETLEFKAAPKSSYFVNVSNPLAVIRRIGRVSLWLHIKIQVNRLDYCATTSCSVHVGTRLYSNSPCFLKGPVRLETVGRSGAYSYMSMLKVPKGVKQFLLEFVDFGCITLKGRVTALLTAKPRST